MIEVLPYLFYSHYEEKRSCKFYKRNRIRVIVYLSRSEKRFNDPEIEEVVIPLDYNVDHFDEGRVNQLLYSYLYDLIEFIFQKVIMENVNVCILGFENRQDIDAILMAYFIKFAQVNYQEAHHYVMSKKLDHYYERSYFYHCLKKYSSQLELLKKVDY